MWERNIDRLSPVCTLTRDQICNLGMGPDPGIKPATVWHAGQCSNQLSPQTRAVFTFLLWPLDHLKLICALHLFVPVRFNSHYIRITGTELLKIP